MQETMKTLHDGKWSPEKLVGVMIDNFMSYNDLKNLRQAFSLKYDPDMDRFMHPVWLVSPFEALFKRPKILRWPEPIPPIEKIREIYKKYEADLKMAVSDDGKIACHRFLDKAIELHNQHQKKGLVTTDVGTEQRRHRLVYSFDAFPVDGLSIEHAVISSADLTVPSQSEDMCKIISVATVKENTEGLNRIHAARRVHKDYNFLSSTGRIEKRGVGGTDIWVEMFICVDKKAVECLRGCAPGCPWCECSADLRLATAWPAQSPPKTWAAAKVKLNQVCRHPFPDAFDIYTYAHVALPFESKPRFCKFCGKFPYENRSRPTRITALRLFRNAAIQRRKPSSPSSASVQRSLPRTHDSTSTRYRI